jgi:hypothetical protein
MNQKINLFAKTKQILNVDKFNEHYHTNNEIKDDFYFKGKNNNQNIKDKYTTINCSYDNKHISIQKNNERLSNLNKTINKDKNRISNILSPMKSDIQNEEIDFQINTTLNQLNNIKSIYNINSVNLQNDFNKIKRKKNKLILVYNSLYHFKQKLLNKEKQIKEKEYKINKYENNLKTNENILKNNLEAFNNYINYQTQNLVNKFKNIKNYHDQKEDELKLREKKIHDYEMIIINIIKQKEEQNKQKLIKCNNIGEQIEKKLEMEMQKLKQKEKEDQIVKDIEIIEKEKEQIEIEKEIIRKEKEQIELDKEKNKQNSKRNNKKAKQLKKREKDFIQKQNIDYDINDIYDIKNHYQTPIRDISNIFDKINNNKNNNYDKKSLTPMIYHSNQYNLSNQYDRNINKYNRDDSLLSYENASNNCNSMRIGNDQLYPIKKINSYIHDNIYLLKNKSNNSNIDKNLYNKTNITDSKRCKSSRIFQKKNYERRNYNNIDTNYFTNRTTNLIGNISKYNISDNTEFLNNRSKNQTVEDKNLSKYLETNSNENNETYNDINKKIFEIEKALQIVKSQDKKIQIIKDKLDKKMKNSS